MRGAGRGVTPPRPSPWPPACCCLGEKGVWGERDEPGDWYSKSMRVVSCVSPPPALDARRDGEGGHLISARISSHHPAQPTRAVTSPWVPHLQAESESQQLCSHPQDAALPVAPAAPPLIPVTEISSSPLPPRRLQPCPALVRPQPGCGDPGCRSRRCSCCPLPLPAAAASPARRMLAASPSTGNLQTLRNHHRNPPCPKLAHKSQHYKNKTVLCVHAHFRLPFKPELVSHTLAEEQRGVGFKRQA